MVQGSQGQRFVELAAIPRDQPALYSLASDELPGWWLIDEQLAEVKRLKGDTAAAKALYEGVIRRNGLPEHMDELARLLRVSFTAPPLPAR